MWNLMIIKMSFYLTENSWLPFKYFVVVFSSEGKMDREIDRWMLQSPVTPALAKTVMAKKTFSLKANILIIQLIYGSILQLCHEF